jgi:signal transduction histidine kinase
MKTERAMPPQRPQRFFLESLPRTLALGLLAVLSFAAGAGLLAEFWLAPGVGWEGRSYMMEGTAGCATLADLDGDGRQERLVIPRPHSSLPPSIKINRQQPDTPLPNLQPFLAGRHLLPELFAASSADGSSWLAALTASADTTTIFLNLCRRRPHESDYQIYWRNPLFTPATHPHSWQNAPELSCFLFVPTAAGERALISVTAHFLGWRGVVMADLGGPEPGLQFFPCGASQNRRAEDLALDVHGRPRLYCEGLIARNGNRLGGLDDSWGGLLSFDPDSGFRPGLHLGVAHNSYGVVVAPDKRHLLLHTSMRFAPQAGDTFNLALVDGWTQRLLWKHHWPGLISAEWGGTPPGAELPEVLVLDAGSLSRCRIHPLRVTGTFALPADGHRPRLVEGHVTMRAPRDELWILSRDGRSRGRIHVAQPRGELLDCQGPGMGQLVVHVLHDDWLESFALLPVPVWRRLGRQPATWWAGGGGLLALFMLLGVRIHRQERLLRGIVDDNAQPVALVDSRGKVLYANREFNALWADEGTRRRLAALLDGLAPEDSRTLETGGRWLRWFRRPLERGPRPLGSVWIGFDETSEREASEGRKFRSLAGMITHELKSPMTPLRLGLDQLRREVEAVHPGGTPGLERVLTRMREELEHMHQLVRQFMRLAGERQPEGRLDLRGTVRQALVHCGASQLSQVDLALRLPAGPAWIRGDGEGLALALGGLLTNALEAMERAGPLVVDLHEARREDGSPGWRLAIQDSGPGIPDELRERIWEPGFSTKPDGYGYGLFFARKVLRQNGAALRLERAAEGGTLALVDWPALADGNGDGADGPCPDLPGRTGGQHGG